MRCGTSSTRIYLDTSAFLKEFSEEYGSRLVHRIFDLCRQGKVTIITSRWTFNESIAALDKKQKIGEITTIERDLVIFTMLRRVEDLISTDNIFATRLTNEVLRFSAALNTDKHLSADDALHLYSAIFGKSDALILADSRFAELAKDSGDFQTFNLTNDDECSRLDQFLKDIP